MLWSSQRGKQYFHRMIRTCLAILIHILGSGSWESRPCRTGHRRYDAKDWARRGPKGFTTSVERSQSFDQRIWREEGCFRGMLVVVPVILSMTFSLSYQGPGRDRRWSEIECPEWKAALWEEACRREETVWSYGGCCQSFARRVYGMLYAAYLGVGEVVIFYFLELDW